MRRSILLVDMDSFFAQVEQRNNPALRGKPVLVGGNAALRHGVVAAASYEAKRFGVKSGMSYFEAKKLCPAAIMIEGNTDKYIDACYGLMEIFREFTDLVECYSIDEAFLDVTDAGIVSGTAAGIAAEIKRRVKEEHNLTCSVGVGPNKLVAKMACKWDKPDGLTVVEPCELPHILWALPVEELVGVGRKMKKHLNRLGIRTIGDLASFPAQTLRAKFGVYGGWLHGWANGRDDSPVDPSSQLVVKSMGHGYTLPADTADTEELRWYVFWLADKVARRLRKDNYRGRTVSIGVRTSDFNGFSKDRTLPFHTDSPHEIRDAAMGLLEANFPTLPIRFLGVRVSGLKQGTPFQMPLYGDALRSEKTLRALDMVKNRYGDGAMCFASIMDAKERIHPKIGVFLTRKEKGSGRSPLAPRG